MFGFGGGNYGGPGEGVGGGPGGPGGAGKNGLGSGSSNKGGGMSPSERNAQGKEGTTSGPGNPGHTAASSSGGKEYSGYGDREGQRAGPGNPGASGSAPGKGDRAGGGTTSSVGADSKEGDRSLSVGVDPSRFGGRSTPTGFGADAKEGDRSLSTGIDPSRFGPSRGFGAAMGEIDRAAQARAAERDSMATYDAAVANTAANAQRADTASSIRTAENTSMKDFDSLKASYRDAIAGIESVGEKDPYSALGGWIASKQDRAYGRYQVMGKNIPSWSKDALGYAITKEDFLANPQLQDAIFDHRFGHYVAKYGLENAAQAWYGGEDSIGKLSRTDPHGKINVGQYGAKVARDQAASYDARKRGLDGSTDVANKPVAESFASTYLGRSARGSKFGVSPEMAYFGDEPTGISDEESAKNVQLQEQRQREAAAAPEDATPKNASIYGSTPKAAEGDFPDRPRSGFEKAAAAGIDIGAGFIPGVGLGVGIVNGVLSLTGNRTIGERLVDAIATGKGGKGVPNNGDPSRREYQVADSTVPTTTKTVPTVESFADSYLSPPDKTKYPTPYERYDLNRNTYAGV